MKESQLWTAGKPSQLQRPHPLSYPSHFHHFSPCYFELILDKLDNTSTSGKWIAGDCWIGIWHLWGTALSNETWTARGYLLRFPRVGSNSRVTSLLFDTCSALCGLNVMHRTLVTSLWFLIKSLSSLLTHNKIVSLNILHAWLPCLTHLLTFHPQHTHQHITDHTLIKHIVS